MMKATFAMACFAGYVAARSPLGKLENNPQFVQFIAANNRSYSTHHELQNRARIFSSNQEKVRHLNSVSRASGKSNAAEYKIGQFGDYSEAEFREMSGWKEENSSDRVRLYNKRGGLGHHRGGLGVVDATTVDHVKDGHMIGVKNQGSCGSCWAFAANSALEGAVSAKTGRDPVRMSEQHLVDCTLRNNSHNMDLFGEDFGLWGCGGGWMATAWYFQSKHGVMLDSDYPYTSGRTQTESRCAHDGSKTIGKVSSWNRIDASGGLDQVKSKLREQPLTIAVDAGSSHFQFYSKGVVGANDGCPTGLNHAVVLVGYTEKDGSPSPDPSPEPEPQPDPDNDAECNVYKWWHSCDEDNSRRMLKDANGYDNYWKIQNSWGTGWGDQGFILFEISEGEGVCGMNSYIEYADM